jgi:hypothetical protein
MRITRPLKFYYGPLRQRMGWRARTNPPSLSNIYNGIWKYWILDGASRVERDPYPRVLRQPAHDREHGSVLEFPRDPDTVPMGVIPGSVEEFPRGPDTESEPPDDGVPE